MFCLLRLLPPYPVLRTSGHAADEGLRGSGLLDGGVLGRPEIPTTILCPAQEAGKQAHGESVRAEALCRLQIN